MVDGGVSQVADTLSFTVIGRVDAHIKSGWVVLSVPQVLGRIYESALAQSNHPRTPGQARPGRRVHQELPAGSDVRVQAPAEGTGAPK